MVSYVFSALSSVILLIVGWFWARHEKNRERIQREQDARTDALSAECMKQREKSEAERMELRRLIEAEREKRHELELRFTKVETSTSATELAVQRLTEDVHENMARKSDVLELKEDFRNFASEIREAMRNR